MSRIIAVSEMLLIPNWVEMTFIHIEAWTKWQMISRRHFAMNLSWKKVVHLDWNFIRYVPNGQRGTKPVEARAIARGLSGEMQLPKNEWRRMYAQPCLTKKVSIPWDFNCAIWGVHLLQEINSVARMRCGRNFNNGIFISMLKTKI